jgi:serine/threonine protein kinase
MASLGIYVIERILVEKTDVTVLLARDSSTNQLVAIKLSKARSDALRREFSFLSDISNTAILKPIELIPLEDESCALVLPYASSGDLFTTVRRCPLNEEEGKSVFYRLAGALRDLHSRSIWHRDIKLENILLLSPNIMDFQAVKLSDFGLAKRFESGLCTDEWVGSPRYAAPELILRRPYTEKVDIWALGVTMFAALTQAFPYDTQNQKKEILAGLPFMFCQLSTQRLTFPAKDLLRKILELDPDKRLSADSIMAHRWFDSVRHLFEEPKQTEPVVGLDECESVL